MREIIEFFESLMKILAERDLWKPLATVGGFIAISAFFLGRSYQKWRVPHDIAKLDRELADCKVQLGAHQAIEDALAKDDDELWKFRTTRRSDDLLGKLADSRVKIMTLANLKGGVGKTTTTASLAAHFDSKGKRVLVIDLDYQGSLSAMLLRASGRRRIDGSLADDLLSGNLHGEKLVKYAKDLEHKANKGETRLSRTKLITATYSLARLENRLMLRWLSQHETEDIRYNLARALLSPEIEQKFDLVLIDAAPRLTTGTINALCASTDFIVPTILDGLSTETLPGFLRQTKRLIKQELNPHLELAGVVATMTEEKHLKPEEKTERENVARWVGEEWGASGHVFDTHIPDRTALGKAAGRDLAYFTDLGENGAQGFFDRLGAEVASRIGLTYDCR